MGTRHLIIVVKDDEYKIAQYGKFDGYPNGEGIDVLNFVKSESNLKKLSKALNKVRFLEEEGRDKKFWEDYLKNIPEYLNDNDLLTPEQKHWFSAYADSSLGVNILKNIIKSEDDEIILKNELNFIGDSLYCEWAYLIDLTNKVLEVYKGFNKNSVITEGRFKSSEFKARDNYEPAMLVASFDLNNLPSDKDFINRFEKEDNDE